MEPGSHDSENTLLYQLSTGNEAAFKILFDRYYDRLCAYLDKRIPYSPQVTRELVMDVFLYLWLERATAVHIRNLQAFLFTIAFRKAMNFLRSASRDGELIDLIWQQKEQAGTEGADSRIVQQEYEMKLRAAIKQLSPQRRHVWQLSQDGGFTYTEIASQLQLSPKTVNNHLVEARRFIRAYLVETLDLALLWCIFQHF